MCCRLAEFGTVRIGHAGHVAGILDNGNLHAEADAEIGHAVLPRVAYSPDFALDATLAKTAGHEDCIHPLENVRALLLDLLGVDILDVDFGTCLDAGMH